MVQTFRMLEKLECISAAALRAQGRASASDGQTPELPSARYSTIARESQTTAGPSTRQGTFPVGENERKPCELPPCPNGTSSSWNGMPSSCMRTHGRNDQDE